MVVFAKVAAHITAAAEVVAEGGVGVSVGVSVVGGRGQGRRVGRRVVGIGSGSSWDVLLELPGGLIGTTDITTACGTFRKSKGDVIGDL